VKDLSTSIFVFGTRPEVIKMAPLIKRLQKECNTIVINTNQQEDLTKEFIREFEIEPDYSLKISSPRSLNHDIASMLTALDATLQKIQSHKVILIVQGDTSTAFSAAIAGFNLQLPVLHLEAGLRTGDKTAPFPEEMFRAAITQIASHHFAPTLNSVANLLASGVKAQDITLSGNTGIDTLYNCLKKIKQIDKKQLPQILVTLHRRENFGQNIRNISKVLNKVAKANDVEIHMVIHPNPAARESMIPEIFKNKNITIYEPQGYFSLNKLMLASDLVITDSGGLQEETAYLGKPLIVARKVTERIEVLESNCLLCSVDPNQIEKTILNLLVKTSGVDIDPEKSKVFGTGNSSEIIFRKLTELDYL
jgi:UDP-N-acetylglucosamine 2-epimerase (non-hydrolysing)